MSDTGMEDAGFGGFAEFLAANPELATGVQQKKPIPRRLRDPETGRFVVSDTPGLVDRSGNLVSTEYYEPEKAALEFYYSMPTDKRQTVLDTLASKWGKIETYDTAIRALTELHATANEFGLTTDAMLQQIVLNVPDRPAPPAARIPPKRVSSPGDLKKIAKSVAKATLGREFSEEEANQFVAAYQQREMQVQQQMATQSGGVITDIEDPTVFAEQFAQQVAPTEANGFKFLGYADLLFNSLEGRF